MALQVCLWCLLLAAALSARGNVRSESCSDSIDIVFDQGLDPQSYENGANFTKRLENASDIDACGKACCDSEDCHLALEGDLQDGLVECFLVNCFKDGENKCRLTDREGSKMYKRGDAMPKAGSDAATTVGSTLPVMSTSEFAEKCEAPPLTGMCRAALPRYHYVSSTSTCQPFIYGGCGGNKNNYASVEQCKATCTVTVITGPSNVAQTPSSKPKGLDACSAPFESGPCRAAFPKFYFDPSAGRCLPFIYGGCLGNDNRYNTLEDCMSRCTGQEGKLDQFFHHVAPPSAAFFLVATLAVISIVLLVGLVLLLVRRARTRRSVHDDKEELLAEVSEPIVEMK
ncbi:kunitz-type protease inhibitor 2 isoform X2 [Paramormyrops kingsleyae]|uniref:Serine peptidase inhibitor, Kunitz type, 2 n=1 Tax=Paramormyrops kingsleyae TaxID=1676925 RepID=A0A3B3RV79_9TELE|nr:kunitz-type protease inhibitor 2-like isoform X2 [Paramormyrops kingsleyae]